MKTNHLLVVCLSYFLLLLENTTESTENQWSRYDTMNIHFTKYCKFKSMEKILRRYPKNKKEQKYLCSQTCFNEESKCTHYIWINETCILKTGYVTKDDVKYDSNNKDSECGIVDDRTSKCLNLN